MPMQSLGELRKLVDSEVLDSEVYVSEKLKAVARLAVMLTEQAENFDIVCVVVEKLEARVMKLEHLDKRVQTLQALAMRVSKLEKEKPKKDLVQV